MKFTPVQIDRVTFSATLETETLKLNASWDKNYRMWYVTGDPSCCAHWLEYVSDTALENQMKELARVIGEGGYISRPAHYRW